MKNLMTLLVLVLLPFIPTTLAYNNCSDYNSWNYHADGICLEWTTPKNTYNGSLSTQMRITCDETVRDLSIWFMLMSSRNDGSEWSQIYVVTESPTLHTLSTEFHAELSFPPNLSIGGSTTTTYSFEELEAGTVRDGIIDINLKDVTSGPVWALMTANWKVNRGWWFIQNWEQKQIPCQYSLTLATYVADLQVMLKELQQNYAALQQDFNTIQNSYNNLQGNYSTLQVTYSTLQANYQALEDNYNTLQSSYNTQTNAYGNITKEFDAVKASREALSTQLIDLQNQYNSLQSKYIQSCDSRVQQLTIFVIVAIVVVVASITATAIIWRHKKKQ